MQFDVHVYFGWSVSYSMGVCREPKNVGALGALLFGLGAWRSVETHPTPRWLSCQICRTLPAYIRGSAWILGLYVPPYRVTEGHLRCPVVAERRHAPHFRSSTSWLVYSAKEIGTHNSSSPAIPLVKSFGVNQIPVVCSGPSLPP